MTRLYNSLISQVAAIGVIFVDKTFQTWAVDQALQKLFLQKQFYNPGTHLAIMAAILYPIHRAVKAPIGFYIAALYTACKIYTLLWGVSTIARGNLIVIDEAGTGRTELPDIFQGRANIVCIFLDHNRLTDLPPSLLRLSSRCVVTVCHNQFSASTIQRIRQKLVAIRAADPAQGPWIMFSPNELGQLPANIFPEAKAPLYQHVGAAHDQ